MYYYWFESKDIRKKKLVLYANYSIFISYNFLRKITLQKNNNK